MPEETSPEEDKISVKKVLFGSGWKPKISPEMDKVFDRVTDFILYGIIYFIAIALFVAMQNNEYQERSYCKVFLDTAKCTCGYDTSILTNRSIALPNPALLPGDNPPFNPLYDPSKSFIIK